MKLQWLKDILGDSYTEEQDAKVCAALGERFVARTDFNDKVSKLKEAEAQVTQLNTAIKTRDTQLEELRKAAGDNAELQKQIDTLTQQNKADKASYEKELASIRLTAAVDAELTAAGARNNVAVRAVLADFLKDAKIVDGKVSAKVGDETVTLAAKVDALKKDAATDFLFASAGKGGGKYEGWKPGEGGDDRKPGAEKKPSEMTYTELAEYLAANPDAKLDN